MFSARLDREESLVHLLQGQHSSSGWRALSRRSPSPFKRQLSRCRGHCSGQDRRTRRLRRRECRYRRCRCRRSPLSRPCSPAARSRYLLQDVDHRPLAAGTRWRTANDFATLHSGGHARSGPTRDAKLATLLRDLIENKDQPPAQPGQPQSDPAVHRIRRHCRLYLLSGNIAHVGARDSLKRPLRASSPDQDGIQSEPRCRASTVISSSILDRVLPALERTPRRSRQRKARARPADRHRLHLGRPEPARLRLPRQLRHPLESRSASFNVSVAIDRIGSPNARIQLGQLLAQHRAGRISSTSNQRVSGRMVLLDISATGEENIIEFQPSGNQMNDLEYRRASSSSEASGSRHRP